MLQSQLPDYCESVMETSYQTAHLSAEVDSMSFWGIIFSIIFGF